MAISAPPIPPESVNEVTKQLQLLVAAQRNAEVATLAAAVITAMGRPVTMHEILEIRRKFQLELYGERSSSSFKEWQKNSILELTTVIK